MQVYESQYSNCKRRVDAELTPRVRHDGNKSEANDDKGPRNVSCTRNVSGRPTKRQNWFGEDGAMHMPKHVGVISKAEDNL